MIRTSLTEAQMAHAEIVTAYMQLRQVETDFAWIKSTDIAVRPVRHWKVERVEAHLMICMLAAVCEHQLRDALRPLTLAEEHPAPVQRSKPALRTKPIRRPPPADIPAT